MNVIDNDKLAATIATALADAQARGVALEDHEAALLHDLLHGALMEASSDVSGAIAPVLDAVNHLNFTIGRIATIIEDFQKTGMSIMIGGPTK